jgi:thiamine-monophosphate kinase
MTSSNNSEFELIKRYFTQLGAQRTDLLLGVGDDCALVTVEPDYCLAISTDLLVEGVHFFADTPAHDLGHKALAVNLSDLAAMGATPAWFTLALTLPSINSVWLQAFSQGLEQLAVQFNVQLIGGDLARGPLNIAIGVHGFVPKGQALLRSGLQVGDKIFVTGQLGGAAYALSRLLVKQAVPPNLLQKLHCPWPRVREGQALLGIAHAAIDISDGLAGDLAHMLNQSGVGACLQAAALPIPDPIKQALGDEAAIELALTGGDDYELCFAVKPSKLPQLHALALDCCCIGTVEPGLGLRLQYQDGSVNTVISQAYQHFSGESDIDK